MTATTNQPVARTAARDELRTLIGELFGAERRLRGREQQQPGSLTQSQMRALLVLDEAEEVTAGDLAKSADLNPASVTAMLDQLEGNGIVERKRDSNDRRVCLVSLTEKGRTVVEQKRAHWQQLWEAHFGHLPDRDLEAGVRIVRALIQLLESV
ncbi:MAG: MarR family transcriptional regulator [Acidimicrobiales bacterium]|nr:MarR family transcriptional regulator [Acidimicrobiales bacterium]